jgi:hypothetical protein
MNGYNYIRDRNLAQFFKNQKRKYLKDKTGSRNKEIKQLYKGVNTKML